MGSEVTYINPTSLKPEIGWAPKNALAGMMYHQNEQDYRRALDQSNRLQDLNETERRYDFAEKQQGSPLREMERQLKSNTIQGQLPHAAAAAGSTMQRQTASNNFDINTQFSPTAMASKLRDYTKNMDDANFEKFTKENQFAASLLETARQIAQSRGEAAAIGFVQQRKQELEAQGFKFPVHFEDPKNWEPMYQAAMNSIPYLQKEKLERTKGELDNEGRRISADATVKAAQIGADASVQRSQNTTERNRNLEQELTDNRRNLQRAIQTGQGIDSAAKAFVGSLDDQFRDQYKQMYGIAAIAPKGEVAKNLEAARVRYIDSQLQTAGLRMSSGEEKQSTPREQPGQPANNSEQLQRKKNRYGLE